MVNDSDMTVIYDSVRNSPCGTVTVAQYEQRAQHVVDDLTLIRMEWGREAGERLLPGDMASGRVHPFDEANLLICETWLTAHTGVFQTPTGPDGTWVSGDGVRNLQVFADDPLDDALATMRAQHYPLLRVWSVRSARSLPFRIRMLTMSM